MFLGMEWYWWLFDCCSAGNLHPVQGKVYEMVEQTGNRRRKKNQTGKWGDEDDRS